MSKPKKNKEQLGLLPAIILFLGGVGLCLINCPVIGVVLSALALGLGWHDLALSHRYEWLTERRKIAGFVILSILFVSWSAYILLKPLFHKPNLIIKLNEITFVGENDTKPTGTSGPGIIFAMNLHNTGARDATVVGAVLVPEGKALSEGIPLTLTPDKLTIRVGDGPYTMKGTLLTDSVQDYRGLRATLILKDDKDREHSTGPIMIQPGALGEPVGN